MSRFILVDGDIAIFMPIFGKAIVTVRPGRLKASGRSTLEGKKICIDGDEKKLSIYGCIYVSAPYIAPGIGTLKIRSLGIDQKAKKTYSGRKKVLLKGSIFIAKFQVQSPAIKPPTVPLEPPTPDLIREYLGTGTFFTTNTKWQAT